LQGKKVWVSGHRGMVGSALVRRLGSEDCEVLTTTRGELDLRDSVAVKDWMAANKPEVVLIASAKVGGILANDSLPADFIYDNIMIAANIIHAAYESGVEKLLNLGSSCIYPRLAPQPLTEDALLTGPLEPTNEWYAIAKIAAIKLCQAYRRQHNCNFISAMPTNLYGPGDNYDLMSSHVMPALIRKMYNAKRENAPSVEVWGSGRPLREFMFVDDLADACIYLTKEYSGYEHVNVGSGQEISIGDLALLIAEIIDYPGTVHFDRSKPDGTPRKLLDTSKLRDLGWEGKTTLREGIAVAIDCFENEWAKSIA
jgi:GDP-L-fucose synthase